MVSLVRVVISGKILGQTYVVPYSHAHGLQLYPGTTDEGVIYKVPCYEVRVEGGSSYGAVRFGLQNKGESSPPPTRICDAGLWSPHQCTPEWVPGYSPHSFRGAARAGAWRLLPGRGFLIHEGADTRIGQVGGSLGCVEILDGRWNDFLAEIESLAHAACTAISAAHKLKVTIEQASYPTATLVPPP